VLNTYIERLATAFAAEYTKHAHTFPFQNEKAFKKVYTVKAQETFDFLYTTKYNKYLNELPESIQKSLKEYGNKSKNPISETGDNTPTN